MLFWFDVVKILWHCAIADNWLRARGFAQRGDRDRPSCSSSGLPRPRLWEAADGCGRNQREGSQMHSRYRELSDRRNTLLRKEGLHGKMVLQFVLNGRMIQIFQTTSLAASNMTIRHI